MKILTLLLAGLLLAGCAATQKVCIEGSGYGASGGICWYANPENFNAPAVTATNKIGK